MRNFNKAAVLAMVALGMVVAGANVASAGWDPAKQLRDARDRAKKSIRTEAGRAAAHVKRAHQMNYVVRVTNPTNQYLFYKFNGQSKIGLRPKSVTTFRGSRVGNPTISFDNGRRQSVRHSLSRSGNYIFRWTNGTLVLYRK